MVLSVYSLLFQPILILNFSMDFNSAWCVLYILCHRRVGILYIMVCYR